MDFHGVFFHMIGRYVAGAFGVVFQGSGQIGIGTVHIVRAILEIDGRIIIGADVCPHGHTEATLKGMVTTHEDKLYFIPQRFIIVIFRPVLEEHVIEALHGVKVAAAQEDDSSFFRKFRFPYTVLRKVKQYLAYRCQDFLKRIIGTCVPDNISRVGHFAIADNIGFGKTPRTGKDGGRVHIVLPGPGFKGVGQSLSAQLIPHSVTFFLLYVQEIITKRNFSHTML